MAPCCSFSGGFLSVVSQDSDLCFPPYLTQVIFGVLWFKYQLYAVDILLYNYPENPKFFYPVSYIPSLFACVIGFSNLAKIQLLILHHQHFLCILARPTKWH